MKLAYPRSDTVNQTIFCGFWKSSNIPMYQIETANALNQLVGYVKFINGSNGTVLYRGQGKDHGSLLPSGCRQSNAAVSDDIILKVSSDKDLVDFFKLSDPEISGWDKYKRIVIESTLQHYGACTYCMDFVDNHWCALWFGLYEFHKGTYSKREDDGFLYLYMYLSDTNGSCVRGMYIGENTYTVDLRKALPSYFLRPAAQHGWVVHPRERGTCTYDDNVVCVAKIKVTDAAKWLGEGELLSQDNFFPDYDIDKGYSVLLHRQKRSGVLDKSRNSQIFPPCTIANYHQHKSFFTSSLKKVLSFAPIQSVSIKKTNKKINNIVELYSILLESGWSRETCLKILQAKWSEKNPCLGHSSVTALLVQKCFGGEIYRFKYSDRQHYFNKISNEIIDLTYHEVDAGCYDRYETATRVGESTQSQKRFLEKNKAVFCQFLENCDIKIKL